MLTKVGNIVLSEEKIPKFKKISMLLFIAGLFLFLAFPCFTNKIFIIEKEIKNSESFFNQVTIDDFNKNINQYIKQAPKDFNKVKETFSIFENFKIDNDIISIDILSPRGDMAKYILINFIYDNENGYINKNLFIIYGFLKHFSIKNNIEWLSKDIRMNLIPRNLFYNKPNEYVKLITEKSFYLKQKIEFIINLDLNYDMDSLDYLQIGINGKNSENVDMDYYKIIFDNLFMDFNLKTKSEYFSEQMHISIYKLFKKLEPIFNYIPHDDNNPINYSEDFIYFLENIINNYIFTEKMNVNNLLISSNFNSILIKTIKNYNENYDITNYKKEDNKKYLSAFNFLKAIERIIKVLSKCEIDIFRGELNYILSSPYSFQGVGFYLFIPVLLVLRIFYEILDNLYKIKYSEINCFKIISYTIVVLTSQFILLIEIENVQNIIQFKINETYYLIILMVFFLSILLNLLLKMSKDEHKLMHTVITFFCALNCFNIFFINYGIGLLVTIVFLSQELICISEIIRSKLMKQTIFSLMILILILRSDSNIIKMIIENYIEFFNNVYLILSLIVICLTNRISSNLIKIIYN